MVLGQDVTRRTENHFGKNPIKFNNFSITQGNVLKKKMSFAGLENVLLSTLNYSKFQKTMQEETSRS